MAEITEELVERFWEKVDVLEPYECWEWMGSVSPNGYGRFFVPWKKGPEYAHRISYKIAFEEDITGKMVLHDCDNPLCVNPWHLHKGNAKLNALERDVRGRNGTIGRPWKTKGEDRGKLNEAQVQAVRCAAKNKELGYTHADLAELYGMSLSGIQDIVYGNSWADV